MQVTWSVDGVNSMTITNLAVTTSNGIIIPTPPAQEPMPVLSPIGAGSLPVTVTISNSDPLAQIYYTTNGTLPTQDSPIYAGALTFNTQTTLRAVAYRANYLPSASAVGNYDAPLTINSLASDGSVFGNGSFLPSVSTMVAPQGLVFCYAFTEYVPPGLTPFNLSGDGVWNSNNNTIEWGPYLDAEPRVFSHNLSGPSGAYQISGQGSFDGYSALSSTETVTINDSYFGPPPTNAPSSCSSEPLTYTVDINPAPGVITVTSASGTVDWGDGTSSNFTQNGTIFEKQYTVTGTYTISVSADWTGYSGTEGFAGQAENGHGHCYF